MKSESITYLDSKSKSYQLIFEAARELMYRHGIRRITVDEICEAAKLSKMTFYRNFENKTELAVRIMEDMFQRGRTAYREIMHSEVPFPEKIRLLIELNRNEIHTMGDEFIKDIYQSGDGSLRKVMETHRQEFMTEYAGDLLAAQKEGWIRPGIRIELILAMLDTLHQKMQDPAIMNMYDSLEEMALELTNFFFYGILTPETAP
ncbi:TetR/AcrR family transcriptional regulator [Salmonirosea aquatica]|uniref:TetR family transcriptional regulator n=1 Tax=Salmonirosea aquatica TaxID=2654236 RepID=A0A7C9BC78_9BACT|nr:TetR family transcriptional regulator [Cytophagaceae bacterium SJW1-29]